MRRFTTRFENHEPTKTATVPSPIARRLGGRLIAWLVIALALPSVAASATALATAEETWAALAKNAHVVVIGKVLSVKSRWEGRQIVSTALVQSIEVLKDRRPAGAPRVLKIRFMGGQVGPLMQDFSHETTFVEGETAALFLGQRPAGGTRPAGLYLLGEDAKVLLLQAKDPASRLTNNRRLAKQVNDLRAAAKAGR